jgi:hypothetical protein
MILLRLLIVFNVCIINVIRCYLKVLFHFKVWLRKFVMK